VGQRWPRRRLLARSQASIRHGIGHQASKFNRSHQLKSNRISFTTTHLEGRKACGGFGPGINGALAFPLPLPFAPAPAPGVAGWLAGWLACSRAAASGRTPTRRDALSARQGFRLAGATSGQGDDPRWLGCDKTGANRTAASRRNSATQNASVRSERGFTSLHPGCADARGPDLVSSVFVCASLSGGWNGRPGGNTEPALPGRPASLPGGLAVKAHARF